MPATAAAVGLQEGAVNGAGFSANQEGIAVFALPRKGNGSA